MSPEFERQRVLNAYLSGYTTVEIERTFHFSRSRLSTLRKNAALLAGKPPAYRDVSFYLGQASWWFWDGTKNGESKSIPVTQSELRFLRKCFLPSDVVASASPAHSDGTDNYGNIPVAPVAFL